jgi:hypothetical protein
VGDQVDIIVADLDLYTRSEVIDLTLNVDANLRESPPLGTPRDTGWAAANWVPSVGDPKYLDADVRDPTAAQVTERAAVATQGQNEVLSWAPADGAIFITNNVPYIQPLNDGHSPQSPPGFVQNAIEVAIRQTAAAGVQKLNRLNRAAAAGGGGVGRLAFDRARRRGRAG